MKTKVLELEYEGNMTKFTIKRFSFGDRTYIEDESCPLKQVGKEMRAFPDKALAKQLTVLKGLANAPFTISLPEIKNLDGVLGEQLYLEIEELNKLPEEKKTTSSGHTEKEPKIPS